MSTENTQNICPNATTTDLDNTPYLYTANELIASFIELNRNAYEQGTKEWLQHRRRFVGGSELASVTGGNPYMKREALLLQKKGVIPFISNFACSWGRLFERAAVEIIAHDYGEPVQGCNIHIDGALFGYPGFAYSPDGYLKTKEHEVALIEIKSPFSRKCGGPVPRHYKTQVLSGLNVSPLANYGLYVEIDFRICDMLDLCSKKYRQDFQPKAEPGTPTHYGIFYLPRGNTDLGSGSLREIYEGIREMSTAPDLQIFGQPSGKIPEILPETGTFLAWKAMSVTYTPIEREPYFLAEKMEKITNFLQDLEDWVPTPRPTLLEVLDNYSANLDDLDNNAVSPGNDDSLRCPANFDDVAGSPTAPDDSGVMGQNSGQSGSEK